MATVENEKLDELLRCSICFDVFTDPRALPCLHTFCLQCITSWCKDKQPEKVACPECRQEFAIPDSGTDGLKKNFFVGNLLCVNDENKMKLKYQRMCEACSGSKKKTSLMFCLQCEECYCESCSEDHFNMNDGHGLVSLDKMQSDADKLPKCQPQYCEKHADKLIELYCLEDEVAICLMCCVLDHRTHQCEEIKKIADKLRVGNRKESLQGALSIVDETLRTCSTRKRVFCAQVKTAEFKICEEADHRIQMIKDHKQNVLSELNDIKNVAEREIEVATQELTRARSSLSNFSEYWEKLVKQGSDVDICREEARLRRRTEELISMRNSKDALQKLSVTGVTFSPGTTTFDRCNSILGGIKADNVPTLAHVLENDDARIAALAYTADELFVTRCSAPHIAVYNSSTMIRKPNIPVPQLGDLPLGLAVCKINKLLFVSDYRNRKIRRIELSTCAIESWTVKSRPQGLSLTARHNLLVSCLQTVTPVGQVLEFSQEGTLIRVLSYENPIWQAIETVDDPTLLLLSLYDGPVHGIAAVFWNGPELDCFGGKAGCGDLLLNEPQSLAVTKKGHVLVADSGNNCVKIVHASLGTARSLQLPANIKLDTPVALCYNEALGRLFVGESGGQHRVLVFDHVTNLDAMFKNV